MSDGANTPVAGASDPDASVTTTHKPVHDKPTLLSYASISSWSWFVYAFGATLALLRDEQHTSTTISGLHGTALAIGGVIGASIAPSMITRFGRGQMLRYASIGCAISIGLYLFPGNAAWATLTMAFIACFFGNLIVVGVNSFLGKHQGPATPAAITESTALAALQGLLAPLAVGLLAGTFLGWRGGAGVAIVAFIVIEFVRGRNTAVFGVAGSAAAKKAQGRLPAITFWAIIAGTCYMGAEFCLSLWGADLLRQQAHLSPAAAAAGLAALTGGIFLGRAFGSRLTQRENPERLLHMFLVASLITFTLTWFTSAATLELIFLFLTGCSFSLVWPLSMARILRSAPELTNKAAGTTLAFTTGAIAVAPFVLGMVASGLSVHTAFIIVPCLLITQFVIVLARPVKMD